MEVPMKATGSCMCKAVTFSFDLKNQHFDVCHCSMCRNWGGGPALTVESAGNIEFSGEENITVYSSSEWAERGFCNKCGSNLFYRLKDKSHNFCNFNLGTLNNHEEFRFTTQIFIDAKPSNYSFSNETKNMTEKDVLEAFGISE
ncbi:MAG: aldehyde-activating protein [Halobacteriovorax sp.]|nr:aldehyde-activating protein [Halobacteriovorax sp.]